MPEVVGYVNHLPPQLSRAQTALMVEWQPILEQASAQPNRFLQVAVEGAELPKLACKLRKIFAHETRYEIVARGGYIWIGYK